MTIYFILAAVVFRSYAHYVYDENESTEKFVIPNIEDLVFEPQVLAKDLENAAYNRKNINCEQFSKYALNCTVNAALMYNSSKKSPPMPAKIADWCRAIRHLTECAVNWNSDCKDVTESHFNEESIKGHMHVVNNVCDDELFLLKYDELPSCIDNTADQWEKCYTDFKKLVDEQKNTTHEWTHFKTHFNLCCARAKFRRCTLDILFRKPLGCLHRQALTLQKFSVIVSEGDVFQDCEHNMMYQNCPGGDPRPSGNALSKMMTAETYHSENSCNKLRNSLLMILASVLINVFIQ